MPTVLIDADGCPVVDLTIRLCKGHGVAVLILCDTAHRIEREGAETLVFDKGADSVDFALVNRVRPGDIVVTQDYGLASMCLARRGGRCQAGRHAQDPRRRGTAFAGHGAGRRRAPRYAADHHEHGAFGRGDAVLRRGVWQRGHLWHAGPCQRPRPTPGRPAAAKMPDRRRPGRAGGSGTMMVLRSARHIHFSFLFFNFSFA